MAHNLARIGTLCALCGALAGAPALAGSGKKANLNVIISGIKNGDGQVLICLFDKPSGFPACSGTGNDAARAFGTKARKGKISFTLKQLPVGTYAISAAHDQNNDGKIERHFLFGYPTEGAGMSNYKKPPRSKPDFEKARFKLAPGKGSVEVIMHYAN